MHAALTIFCSGDTGSLELKNLCRSKGVPYVSRDIRKASAAGKLEDLEFLARRHLHSVPQVWAGEKYLGGFSDAEQLLSRMPTLARPTGFA